MGAPECETQGQVAYMPSWAKEQDRGLELQRKGRQFIGRWEERMFDKQMFAKPVGESRTRRGL